MKKLGDRHISYPSLCQVIGQDSGQVSTSNVNICLGGHFYTLLNIQFPTLDGWVDGKVVVSDWFLLGLRIGLNQLKITSGNPKFCSCTKAAGMNRL